MIIELVIPGEPAVKERPRCTGRGAISTKKQKAAEGEVARMLQEKYIVPTVHTGEVSMDLRFYTGRLSKDIDNMAKLVMDALCGVLYADDEQITDLSIEKRHARGWMPGPETRVRVFLWGETEVIARE